MGAETATGDGGGIPPLAVLVAHDHEVLALGLRAALSAEPWVARCLHATDLPAVEALARRYLPRVAVVGDTVAGLPAEAVARRLIACAPQVRVVLLRAGDVPAEERRAAGAWAAVDPAWRTQEVVGALAAVAAGRTRVPRPRAKRPPLSPQQLEVLRRLAGGATNREIAAGLGISPHTTKDHVAELFRRLQVRNRAQAVQVGQRTGLIA
jgi:DNA-binding NarL/FixJ family response regulator